MTTQLAIGYLAGTRRNPHAAVAVPPVAAAVERDPLASRPAIPQAVITWSDEDALPLGAGDPAVAIDGPPSFAALGDRAGRPTRLARLSIDAALFGVVVLALVGLAGAVGFAADDAPGERTLRSTIALEAVRQRATVEVGELRIERPAATVVTAKAGTSATVAN